LAPRGAMKGTLALQAVARAGVEHEVLTYDIDTADGGYGRAAAGVLGLAEASVFKTLVAMVDGRPAVAVVPVSGQVALKAFAAALGAKRAEMADVAVAERLTGYVVGGISPLGQKRRLPTVIDESALSVERMYVSGGRRGLEIGLAPADLVRLTEAVVAPIVT
jgi:Cys-tRNA(Pro)/Cys-tRNA(Cys) deacylase